MNGGGRVVGTALVGIGLLMLLEQVGVPGLGWLWPLLVLGLGIACLWHYRSTRGDSGLVFTGTLLVVLGLFFHAVRFEFLPLSVHWPFFVLAPSLGLLAMARVDSSRRDAMVPAWIGFGATVLLYFFSSGLVFQIIKLLASLLGLIVRVLVPLGLIGLGAWLVFSQRHGGHEKPDFPEKVRPEPAPEEDPDFEDEGYEEDEEDEEDEEYDEEYDEDEEEVGIGSTVVPPTVEDLEEEADYEEIEGDDLDDDPGDDLDDDLDDDPDEDSEEDPRNP